jgi:hypothetical protein
LHIGLSIEILQANFEAGDNRALLTAVAVCARDGMTVPPWAAEAFYARYAEWARFEVRTLDEAFGVKRKGSRLANLAFQEKIKESVILKAYQLHAKDGLPLGDELFDCVGASVRPKISGAAVKKIIYAKNNEPLRKLAKEHRYGRTST